MQGVRVAEPSGGTSIQALGVHLSENVGSTHRVLHGAVCLSLIKKKKKKVLASGRFLPGYKQHFDERDHTVCPVSDHSPRTDP